MRQLLYLLLVRVALTQVYFNEKCSKLFYKKHITPTDTKLRDLEGAWYQIQRFPNLEETQFCVCVNYTISDDGNYALVNYEYRNITEKNVTTTEDFLTNRKDDLQRARFKLMNNERNMLGNNTADYVVLMHNRDELVIYSCRQIWMEETLKSQVYLWTLSRTFYILPERMKVINKLIKNNNLDPNLLENVTEPACKRVLNCGRNLALSKHKSFSIISINTSALLLYFYVINLLVYQ